MTDRRVVLIVVIMLGTFALGGLAALTWLVHGKTPGDQLAIIAGPMGVALGALSAVLVSTRTTDAPPQPVQIVNEQDEAVPVADVPPKRGRGSGGYYVVSGTVILVVLFLLLLLLVR